jgi:hypothetical protein
MSGAQGWALQQKSGEGRDQLIERIAFIRSQPIRLVPST